MVIGPSGAGVFYDDVLSMVEMGILTEEDLIFIDRDRLLDDTRD